MEPSQNKIEPIQEEVEKTFKEHPFEEVEDGYIDDRAFTQHQTEVFGMTTKHILIIWASTAMGGATINTGFISQDRDMTRK